MNTKEDIIKYVSTLPDYYDSYSILIEIFAKLFNEDSYRAINAIDRMNRLSNSLICDMILEVRSNE